MARLRINRDVIPQVQQQVIVGGVPLPGLWCSQVDHQHGLGGTTAKIEIPFVRADQIGDLFQDLKVIVNAGLEGSNQMRCIFAGFLSTKTEDISETTDGVSLTAYTAAHYLDSAGVGEDNGAWNRRYALVDEDTGQPTGWTPLRVLLDLFTRLPEDRLEHLKLGNIAALGTAYDIPTQVYDFSLTNYREAIETIVESMGRVAIRELFYNGVCYIDFFVINDPAAPVNLVSVSDLQTENNPTANVLQISPSVDSSAVINRAIAFGRDKEFMITCKSTVSTGGAAQFSEPNPLELFYPLTGLVDDWDHTFDDIVLKDPKLASAADGRLPRTAVTKPQEYGNGKVNGQDDGADAPATPEGYPIGPGPFGTTFWVDVGVHLVPNKTILIHQASGERMLVTAYTPFEDADPGDPDNDPVIPPIAKRYAEVTVVRLHEPASEQEPGFIGWNDPLAIEIPGIEHVFRRFQLPACMMAALPKLQIQSDLPVMEAGEEGEKPKRQKSQAFQYTTNLVVDTEVAGKKVAVWNIKPRLIDGFSIDKEKGRITLSKPAVQPVTQIKKTVGTKTTVETTYEPTVVGVTFSYIDPSYTFGWDTGAFAGNSALPWVSKIAREQYDELVYQQATNQTYPIPYTSDELPEEPQNVVFNCIYIDPDSGAVTEGGYGIRSDINYLKTLAFKLLGERFRRHVTADTVIPWLDVGYVLGCRVALAGLQNQPRELLTISGVTYSMPKDGAHATMLIYDNVRPPYRRNLQFKAVQPASMEGVQ